MGVEVIQVSMRGADDTPAQDKRILQALRRHRLLNQRHVFRGFRRRNLKKLLEVGIDHDPRKSTFVSTRDQLKDDPLDTGENALRFALEGGCLAVYREPLVSDGALGCRVPSNIRDQLVAVIVINW